MSIWNLSKMWILQWTVMNQKAMRLKWERWILLRNQSPPRARPPPRTSKRSIFHSFLFIQKNLYPCQRNCGRWRCTTILDELTIRYRVFIKSYRLDWTTFYSHSLLSQSTWNWRQCSADSRSIHAYLVIKLCSGECSLQFEDHLWKQW